MFRQYSSMVSFDDAYKNQMAEEALPRWYITANQFRLIIGLLTALLVAVLSLFGLGAFLVRQHVLSEAHVHSKIGFTATGTFKKGFVKDEVILFKTVLINDGNGFDQKSGTFTCPRSGVYLFSFTIATHQHKRVYAYIYINSEAVLKAAVESQADDHDTQEGNTALWHLNVGDRVWVSTDLDDNWLEEKAGYTTFAGVYMYE